MPPAKRVRGPSPVALSAAHPNQASLAHHSCSVWQIGRYERPKNTGMVRNRAGANMYWSGCQLLFDTPDHHYSHPDSISIGTQVASHSRMNGDTHFGAVIAQKTQAFGRCPVYQCIGTRSFRCLTSGQLKKASRETLCPVSALLCVR